MLNVKHSVRSYYVTTTTEDGRASERCFAEEQCKMMMKILNAIKTKWKNSGRELLQSN